MRWLNRVTIALLALALALLGWTQWELARTLPDDTPDEGPWGRAASGSREVLLPLTLRVEPVTRLALLEFEAGSDATLAGLEPQWVDRGHEKGWRVLAYRTDGAVDVYDDPALTLDPTDEVRVAGQGKRRHEQVPIEGAAIERDEVGRARIAFAFTDADGRRIAVDIQETTTRRSVPTNLLAPIGQGSERPDSFPLFLLHDFEFLRLAGSRLDVTIDGRPVALQGFPVPLPLQWQQRSFAKYTVDADLIAVFPTAGAHLRRVATRPGTDVVEDGGVRYLFAGDALERIRLHGSEVVFEPPLDIGSPGEGRFTITNRPHLGSLAGPYRLLTEGDATRLDIGFDRVTVPHQRDPLYRMIVNENSFFGTWPKGYSYQATIDRASGTIDALWRNAGD